jgi:Ca2+/Na+ antiporter
VPRASTGFKAVLNTVDDALIHSLSFALAFNDTLPYSYYSMLLLIYCFVVPTWRMYKLNELDGDDVVTI